MQDPFFTIENQVKESIKDLQILEKKWRKLLSTNTYCSEEFKSCHAHIKKMIKEIGDDISDLNDSIVVVEKFPFRFNLDTNEVKRRKIFITEARAALDNVNKVINSPETNAKIEKDKKLELLNQSNNKVIKSTTTNTTTKQSSIHKAIEEDNDEFLRDNTQIQQNLFNQQNEELDELQNNLVILRSMANTMNTNLKEQGETLDRLNSRADKSSGTLNSLYIKLDKLINGG